MTNGKLKISFEVTDIWNREEFRELIKLLFRDPVTGCKCEVEQDQIEMFLISNNDSTPYIQTIGKQLGLDSAHIIVTNLDRIRLALL